MSTSAHVSVVVVNWNSGDYLSGCLASILDQTQKPAEVVIIDNASSDGSPANGQATLERHPHAQLVRWIFNRENVGYSRAANQGIRATSGEWLLLLNQDVLLTPTYLERAWDRVSQQDDVGSLSGKVLRFDRRTIDTTGQFLRSSRRIYERGYGEVDAGQYDQPGEVFSVCGGIALYRRAMLSDVAIEGECFDEDFFAFYEDADLGWRAHQRGWRCWYEPTALAYHARGSTNRDPDSSVWSRWQMPRRPLQIQFHILVNRYLMLIKNERMSSICARLPALMWAECVDWAYIVLIQPRLLRYVPEAWRLMKRAFMKRDTIMQVEG